MTIGSFNASVKQIEVLLKIFNLFRQKGIKSINNDGVSDDFKRASQKSDYFSAYKTAISNYDFDFLLYDQSFFQFEFKNKSNGCPDVRYAFFQNPQEYKSYEQYLDSLRQEGNLQETNEQVGDIFKEEYEQYLIEKQINLTSTSIRFDVDFNNYKPHVHSVAHIHVGHQNNIRIPCNKIITPYKFVLFVLKHIYYHSWKEMIESENQELQRSLSNAKTVCLNLDDKKWTLNEERELFIS